MTQRLRRVDADISNQDEHVGSDNFNEQAENAPTEDDEDDSIVENLERSVKLIKPSKRVRWSYNISSASTVVFVYCLALFSCRTWVGHWNVADPLTKRLAEAKDVEMLVLACMGSVLWIVMTILYFLGVREVHNAATKKSLFFWTGVLGGLVTTAVAVIAREGGSDLIAGSDPMDVTTVPTNDTSTHMIELGLEFHVRVDRALIDVFAKDFSDQYVALMDLSNVDLLARSHLDNVRLKKDPSKHCQTSWQPDPTRADLQTSPRERFRRMVVTQRLELHAEARNESWQLYWSPHGSSPVPYSITVPVRMELACDILLHPPGVHSIPVFLKDIRMIMTCWCELPEQVAPMYNEVNSVEAAEEFVGWAVAQSCHDIDRSTTVYPFHEVFLHTPFLYSMRESLFIGSTHHSYTTRVKASGMEQDESFGVDLTLSDDGRIREILDARRFSFRTFTSVAVLLWIISLLIVLSVSLRSWLVEQLAKGLRRSK